MPRERAIAVERVVMTIAPLDKREIARRARLTRQTPTAWVCSAVERYLSQTDDVSLHHVPDDGFVRWELELPDDVYDGIAQRFRTTDDRPTTCRAIRQAILWALTA